MISILAKFRAGRHGPARALLAIGITLIVAACARTPLFDRDAVCSRSVLECAPFLLEPGYGRIDDPMLSEVSGLAVTRNSDERLWVVNDSGGEAALYLVNDRGRYLGRVRVDGAANVDWEELAAFSFEGRPHLLIADVGDNGAQRPSVTLYVVEEPRFEGARPPMNARVAVRWIQEFTYEDGPRDCESVAVDPDTGNVLLISKRTNPPVLYELPLGPEYAEKKQVAKRIASVAGLPVPMGKEKLPNNRFGKYSYQNTAMDISSDNRSAVVLTYGATWLFERSFDETWASAFSRDPKLVATPFMLQAEALAFTPDGRDLYITSEGIPAPFMRLRREEAIPIPR